jgi:predicted DNA-binding antitoxin AbrB/MazE fold protein
MSREVYNFYRVKMIGDYRMKTIQAVYQDGVFRPIGVVVLPEKTTVEFEPRVLGQQQDNAMLEAFEILSHSFDSGQPDLAARHNEHQP